MADALDKFLDKFGFKSNPLLHEEGLARNRQQLTTRKAEFVREAIESGFTQPQADLMVKYLSFRGHIHEYVNVGYKSTTRDGDYTDEWKG